MVSWKQKAMKFVVFFTMMGMLFAPFMQLGAVAAPATGLTIHFKKPTGWGTPSLYFYDQVPATVPGVQWATAPAMTDEGNGWFAYTIAGATGATVIFKDTSNQIPSSGPGFIRSAESWYDSSTSTWTLTDPNGPQVVDTEKPTAPTNLKADVVKSKSVTLSWTASTDNIGIDKYEVWKNGAKITDVDGLTYFAFGLTAETKYTFAVRAKDAGGNFSDVTSLEVTTAKSTGPEGLTIHFKKPAAWGVPALYYYGVKPDGIPNGSITWNESPAMTDEGNGWFVHTIDYATEATVIFKDNTGKQVPASGGFLRTAEGWYDGTTSAWSETDPVPDTTKPTAPANLLASDITETGLKLAWTASTDNKGVTGYEVWQNDAKIADSVETMYTVAGLTAATPYSFKVRAKDAAGNFSDVSNIVQATTLAVDTEPPTAPADLAASDITTSSVKLTWTASTDNRGVTGYEVWQNNAKIADSATTTYSVAELTADTTYSFKVRAKDAAGNFSDVSLTIQPKTLPSAPADSVAPTAPTQLLASDVTATGAKLDWTASTDNVAVTGYEVWKDGVKLADSATNSYTVSGLSAETKYKFKVRATDAAGNFSDVSNEIEVTTLAATTGGNTGAPTTPVDLTASNVTPNGVVLTWTASTDDKAVTGYEVWQDDVKIADTAATTYTVIGLTPKTKYSFKVRAVDADNNFSAASTAIEATTLELQTNKVIIFYKRGFATPYIHYAPKGTSSWTTVPGVALGASEYVGYSKITLDIGSATGITAAFNNGANSWDSNNQANYSFNAGTWTFTPAPISGAGTIVAGEPKVDKDSEVPTAPKDVKISGITTSSMIISWTESTDNILVSKYEIWSGETKVGESLTNSFTVTGLTSDTEYKYVVRAVDIAGNNSTLSAEVSAKTTSTADAEPPTKPIDLVSSKLTYNSLTLTWTASTDNAEVTGYEVWKDGLKLTTVTTTSYDVSGLKGDTLYKFAVRAFDASGNNSDVSDEISVNTLPTPQNKVIIYYRNGFKTPHVHYSPLSGTWTTPPGVKLTAETGKFIGYYKATLNIGPETSLIAAFNDGANNWDSNNMKNYTFEVGTWTYKAGANGAAGTIVAGEPTELVTKPSAPTGLAFTYANDIAKATWKASTGATGYKVLVNNALTATLAATTTYNFNTSKWVPGQSYTIQVVAFNEAGDSAKSTSVKGMIPKQTILIVGKKVYINGKALPASVKPETINGRMYLPFKAIFEPFGVKGLWNNKTKVLNASKTNFKLTLTINSKSAKLNGKNVTLDAPPAVVNGSTYVPVRFIADSLGVTLEYRAK